MPWLEEKTGEDGGQWLNEQKPQDQGQWLEENDKYRLVRPGQITGMGAPGELTAPPSALQQEAAKFINLAPQAGQFVGMLAGGGLTKTPVGAVAGGGLGQATGELVKNPLLKAAGFKPEGPTIAPPEDLLTNMASGATTAAGFEVGGKVLPEVAKGLSEINPVAARSARSLESSAQMIADRVKQIREAVNMQKFTDAAKLSPAEAPASAAMASSEEAAQAVNNADIVAKGVVSDTSFEDKRNFLTRIWDKVSREPIPVHADSPYLITPAEGQEPPHYFMGAPALTLSDLAKQSASARIAVYPETKNIISRALPQSYKDVAYQTYLKDILNKDNILAGHHFANQKMMEAQTRMIGKGPEFQNFGDIAEAQKWSDAMNAIAKKHDLKGYLDDVTKAWSNPTIQRDLKSWDVEQQKVLGQDWKDIKALDPDAALEGRGLITKVRTNLVSALGAARAKALYKDPEAAMPNLGEVSNNIGNPSVKPDPFDIQAKFSAPLESYSNNLEDSLLAVMSRRFPNAANARYLKALVDSKSAIPTTEGAIIPEGSTRGNIPFPVTDPATGVTTMVPRYYLMKQELWNEAQSVLGLNAGQNTAGALARWSTAYTLASTAEFASHIKNLHTKVISLPEGSDLKTVLMRSPLFATGKGAWRWGQAIADIAADSPEMRETEAFLARNGMMRPEYPQVGSGVTAITHSQDAIRILDRATRLLSNEAFNNEVALGKAVDTLENRYNFINEIGQYNMRLHGPIFRWLKEKGMAPFAVAGQSFTAMGVKKLLGSPGLEATTFRQAMQYRASGLATVAGYVALPAILNHMITGEFFPKDVPVFSVALSRKPGPDGKIPIWNLGQLAGLQRGETILGGKALVEGLRAGQNANQIAGNAYWDAMRGIIYPYVGPAPRLVSEALLHKQIGFEEMNRKVFPEGGFKQVVEDFRAPLENANPLIYGSIRPVLRASGIDTTIDRPESGFGPRLLRSVGQPLGFKMQSPTLSAAGETAKQIAMTHYVAGTSNQSQYDRHQLRLLYEDKIKSATTPEERDALYQEMQTRIPSSELASGDIKTIAKQSQQTSVVQRYATANMSVPELWKVYDEGTPEEQQALYPVIVQAFKRNRKTMLQRDLMDTSKRLLIEGAKFNANQGGK